MSFNQSVIVCLSKYINVNGRASRSEFWWFQLFVVLAQLPFGILLNLLDVSSVIYVIINNGIPLDTNQTEFMTAGQEITHQSDKSVCTRCKTPLNLDFIYCPGCGVDVR